MSRTSKLIQVSMGFYVISAWSLLLYDGPNLSIQIITDENATESSESTETSTATTATTGTTNTAENTDTGTSETGTAGSGTADSKTGSGSSRRRRSDESGSNEGSNNGAGSAATTTDSIGTESGTTSQESGSDVTESSSGSTESTETSTDPTEACRSYIFVDEPWYNSDFKDILISLLEIKPVANEVEITGSSESETDSQSLSESGQSTETGIVSVCIRQRPTPLYPELMDLCTRLYASWECLNKNAFLMDESITATVKVSMQAVLQVASEKCRGIFILVFIAVVGYCSQSKMYLFYTALCWLNVIIILNVRMTSVKCG